LTHFDTQGLIRYIYFPQIIVCGDQSSGKSSVLEAVSGIDFPTKDATFFSDVLRVILSKCSQKLTTILVTVEVENSCLRDFCHRALSYGCSTRLRASVQRGLLVFAERMATRRRKYRLINHSPFMTRPREKNCLEYLQDVKIVVQSCRCQQLTGQALFHSSAQTTQLVSRSLRSHSPCGLISTLSQSRGRLRAQGVISAPGWQWLCRGKAQGRLFRRMLDRRGMLERNPCHRARMAPAHCIIPNIHRR
jgi:hypothetical protein